MAREARRFHARSGGVYGCRQVAEDIRPETEVGCSKETARRVMPEDRWCAKARHSFVGTTPSRHSRPVGENLQARDFTAEAPNRQWEADLTHVRTGEGGLYLASVLDLYSRRVGRVDVGAGGRGAGVFGADDGVSFSASGGRADSPPRPGDTARVGSVPVYPSLTLRM